MGRAKSESVEAYRDHPSDDLIVILGKRRKVRLTDAEFCRFAREHFPILGPIPSLQRRRAWPAYLRSKGIPQWAINRDRG